MWLPLAVGVLVLSADRVSPCKAACAAHVSSPKVRARVCGRCFTDSERAAWALKLAAAPEVAEAELEGLLADPDWAVRWGGVRALAVRRGLTEGRVLSDWVAEQPALGCATAVHAAGLKKQTAAQLLQPTQAALCWARRAAITAALEVELYHLEPGVRLEALAHLAAFLERSPSRVVLEAMRTRAPETDDLSAGLLIEAGRKNGAPAARALLEAAKADADEPLVNRLLAQWARQIDLQRPRLQSPERQARREAIAELADLAPLAGPELASALDDPDPGNRRAAAAALAAGQHSTVARLAAEKLDPHRQADDAERVRWVAAVATSQDPGCAATLNGAIDEAALSEAVREAAAAALADCAGQKALPRLAALRHSKVPGLRAGATLALASLPREPSVSRLLQGAFEDPEPVVLAAACRAAAALKHRPATAALVQLSRHADEAVRGEAVAALAALESPAAVPALMRALGDDRSARVREIAARALGSSGSAAAVPALISASESDGDATVKFVATESLRKLGFERSPVRSTPP